MSKGSVAFPMTLWDLVQGLVTEKSSTQIQDRACSACQNVVGVYGKLRRRAGWKEALSSLGASLAVHHLGRRVGMDGTVQLMALGRNTGTGALSAFYWDGAAWQNITGGAALTLTSGVHAYSTVFKGSWYFTTSNDPLYKWSGAGNISEVTNANAALRPFSKPRIVFSWDARLWTADSEDGAGSRVPYRLAWSDHLLDNVWRGGVSAGSSGYVDLADDSDPITGLVDQVDYMVVFKPTIVYLATQASAPDWYTFPKLTRGIGCVSGATIQRYFETLIWLGDENVYLMEGRQVTPIGNPIRNRLKDVVSTTNLSRAFAILDPADVLYWLFLPKTGTSNLITLFVLSLRDGAWYEGELALNSPTTLLPLCGIPYRSGTWTWNHYVGSSNGKVYVMDTSIGTDDGKDFSPSWTSKAWDAVALSSGKFETMGLQRVAVHGSSGRIRVQVKHGPNLDSMVTDTVGELILDGLHPKYLSCNIVDRFMQIILNWYDKDNPPQVEGLTLHIMERGEVR